MSTVTLTLTDHADDPNVVNIKWDVTEDEGTGAAKALAQHLIEHLESIRSTTDNALDAVVDLEPKE
jgi:hypothetical protein